jgi:hypothetical protein
MSQDPSAFSKTSSIGVSRVKNGGYSISKLLKYKKLFFFYNYLIFVYI